LPPKPTRSRLKRTNCPSGARLSKRTLTVYGRYLHDALSATGKRKIETPRAVVRIQGTAESVRIVDDAEFITWAKLERDDLLNYAEPSINRTAVKQAIKDGQTIPGAALERGETVVIK